MMYSKLLQAGQFFYKADGAAAFFIPYMIIATLGMFLINIYLVHAMGDVFRVFVENPSIFVNENPSDQEVIEVFSALSKAMSDNWETVMAASVLNLVFWSILLASINRHYVRGEKFSINLAKDEFRIVLAHITGFIVFIAAVFFAAVGAAITSAILALISPFLAKLMLFVMGGIMVYGIIRMSVIVPLIIRDRAFRFWRSIGETDTKVGYLLACTLIYFLFFTLISVSMTQLGVSLYAGNIEDDKLAESLGVYALLDNGNITSGFAVIMFLSSAISAVYQYVAFGPLAYAVTYDQTTPSDTL